MPKRPPQSQFGGNLPTYLQNKASSSQFTYFFGDSMEIRQKNWHSQKNTELSSNFDGFGGKLGEKTHKQKCKKSPPGKIGAESTYLPPGSCSSLFFSSPLARSSHFESGFPLATTTRTGHRAPSVWHRLGGIPPRCARTTSQKQGFPKSPTL